RFYRGPPTRPPAGTGWRWVGYARPRRHSRRPQRANGDAGPVRTWQTILLGAIAGLTIFLGLPMGRVRTKGTTSKTFMTGLSAGILVFLFFDILKNATNPLELAVRHHTWATVTGLGLVFAAGVGVGLLG